MDSTFPIEDIPLENDAWTRHVFRKFTGIATIEECAEKCGQYFPCDMVAYEGTSCHLGDSLFPNGTTTLDSPGPVTILTYLGKNL